MSKVLLKVAVVLGVGCQLCFTGCQTTDAYTGEKKMTNTAQKAMIGAAGGAILGAVIGNNTGDGDAGRGAVIGAAAGGLTGAGVGAYMDKQEAVIRARLRGTGVSVSRVGNDLILNMPNDVTFASSQSEIRPSAANTLDSVAVVLVEFNKTLVTVNGHADSTGNDASNLTLSQNRASAVTRYLAGRGVVGGRLIPRGFGESQPIAPNTTESGKAQNRRVEIHIVPNQT